MVPRDVLHGVIKFIGFACLAYLYLKLWSWAASFYYSQLPERDLSLELLTTNTPYGFTFWWGEVFFGALVPAVIFLWSRLRRHTSLVMIGAALVIMGLVMNRWNVTLSGFVVPLDWSPGVRDVFPISTYAPALVEWGVAIGILGYGALAFTLGVRYLNLYPYVSQHAESAPHDPVEPAAEISAAAGAGGY
jgi:Ni/Fe-hydrogenase subunit HybB-like protein